MPDVIVKYACKYCKYVYNNAEEAIQCEDSHSEFDNIESVKFIKNLQWPHQIKITDKSGKRKVVYNYYTYEQCNQDEK